MAGKQRSRQAAPVPDVLGDAWRGLYAAMRPVEPPEHARTKQQIAADLGMSETSALRHIRALGDKLQSAKRGNQVYYWPKATQ